MAGFSGARLRDMKNISKELSNILQTTCLHCYNQFDKGARRPYLVGPCQHHYCAQCIDEVVFNRGEEADCPQCLKQVTRPNIRRNTFLEQVIEIQNEYNGTTTDKAEMKQLEQQIARKFLSSPMLFCRFCEDMFNLENRRPVMICSGQHVMCTKCLTGQLKNQHFCRICTQPVFAKGNLYFFKLFELMLEFISIALFTRKIMFIVDERQINLAVDEQVTIKNVFHLLQEHQIISRELQIKECMFYHLVPLQDYREEQRDVDYTDSVRAITRDATLTIIMRYQKGALKKGSRVTMPSKIVKRLPIKLNNFEKDERFDERDMFEGFGQFESKQQVNPNWLKKSSHKIKQIEKKQEPLYPELPPPKFSKYQINSKMQPEKPQYRQLNDEPKKINERPQLKVSSSKMQLVQKSQLQQEKKEEERNMRSQIRSSKIPKRQEKMVGTEISDLFMENITTKVPPGNARNQILADFLDSHIINPKDESLVCFQTEKLINRPFTADEYTTSATVEKELQANAAKGDTRALLLTILKQEIEDGEIRVLFSPKSTQRSRMSLKIITSHFISDRLIIKETIDEDEHWFFEKLYESQKELAAFLDQQRRRITTKFGISEESLVFHRLVKGSLELYMSTNEGHEVSRNIKRNLDRNIEIQPFFKQLILSPEDFDKSGLIKFNSSKKDVEFRGNWPYYQPINSVRFGIKVSGQFDQGSNTWLSMDNKPGQWAVGFHGVRNPNNNYKNYKNVIESIIGSSRSNIIVESEEVSHQSQRCANQEGTMGTGVVLTPSFEVALSQTEDVRIGSKTYHLVFQCRLKPEQIKISSRDNCKWLVNRSSAIRPYGIVIIENAPRLAYPSMEEQFGKTFRYSDFKGRIEAKKKE